MDVQDPEEQFKPEPLEPTTDLTRESQTPEADLARDVENASHLEDASAAELEGENAAAMEEAASGEEESKIEVSTQETDTSPAPQAVDIQPEAGPEPVAEEVAREPAAPSRRGTGVPFRSDVPSDISAEPAWYVIHCYSGYENKVRHNLEQRIETMGMKDRIFDVVIPTQEEIEVRDGKRRTVERHIFPGYVLVNMSLSEESWYVVRNTPGVTGFVGMGNLPTPLRPEEVSQIIKRMEAEAPTVKVTFKVGERVRIIDGPFNDFRGTVSEIDMERTKARVMVSFFGRDTPVELDFLQVEKA
jgi:transcription termination/antitermination protein NusG